ncbi:hypothetical protein CEN49_20600 [Fischerella thermalis CCMEE 5273]|nr:hypothetical protein CBP19_20065 [Fischerella thermalis WC1110]PLZ29367.1 hypothetical protein CBP10_15725 [Fischerella thermalis WC558]PLZ33745.1 hypothetical protein CBP27_16695 [Fischerella thermalis WC542]PLZ36972.1 hypothetical protein CBP26_20535 [Fischerella thermalis WC538]PLZ43526.1 hypothetical protein CBP25_12850 [Fischerella thermalis WC527]PLZ57526.1 hypothetical protein CBP15_04935 [Fischerella thermalis WC442]PLZ58330.1 hypothetical protein CBP24_08360 [Fischerella thermalis
MPPGFAHRFVVFSKVAKVFYKTTDSYAPNISDASFGIIPTCHRLASHHITNLIY